MTPEEQDLILRDFLISTSTLISKEEWEKIDKEAAWIRLTDDGIEFSQGWCDLMKLLNEGKS